MRTITACGKYKKEVEKRVDDARAAFDHQVSLIAAEVRKNLVVPLCLRRDFTFVTGNGRYAFYGKKNNEPCSYSNSLDPDTPADVRRVLAVLDTEVTHGQYLGFFVECV